jgi:hypothetical protein
VGDGDDDDDDYDDDDDDDGDDDDAAADDDDGFDDGDGGNDDDENDGGGGGGGGGETTTMMMMGFTGNGGRLVQHRDGALAALFADFPRHDHPDLGPQRHVQLGHPLRGERHRFQPFLFFRVSRNSRRDGDYAS